MPTKQRKRGTTIFRVGDAVNLGETDFMTPPETASGITQAVIESIAVDAPPGAEIKVLTRDAGGFSLVHVWLKANYPLPRHSHNVDCMYYVISGRAIMGSQTLRPGDSFFVPAGAAYQYSGGPEGVEVLEVRYGVEQFDIKLANSPAQWQKFVDATLANRKQWTEDQISPTLIANAG